MPAPLQPTPPAGPPLEQSAPVTPVAAQRSSWLGSERSDTLYGPYPELRQAALGSRAAWRDASEPGAGDWNERWQQAWELPAASGPQLALRRYNRLCEVQEAFERSAVTVVQQIVDGLDNPERQRSSAAAVFPQWPGVYVAQGIVCIVHSGGSAAGLGPSPAACSRELRVLAEVQSTLLLRDDAPISVPLACLTAYRGVRMWCHALLRHGSAPALTMGASQRTAAQLRHPASDAAGSHRRAAVQDPSEAALPSSLRCNDDELLFSTAPGGGLRCTAGPGIGAFLARVSERLGMDGDSLSGDATLYLPAAARLVWCRGDNRTYLHDIWAWCPEDGCGGALRPELLRTVTAPGISGTLLARQPEDERGSQLDAARRRLRHVQCPAAARLLAARRVRDACDVKAALHQEGVPLRLLGAVLGSLRASGRGSPAVLAAESAVVEEMTARTFRALLWSALADERPWGRPRPFRLEQNPEHAQPQRRQHDTERFGRRTVHMLRLLLDSGPDSEQWWMTSMVPRMVARYGVAPERPAMTHHTTVVVPASLHQEDAPAGHGGCGGMDRGLVGRLVSGGRLCVPLLRRVQELCGFQLEPGAACDEPRVRWRAVTKLPPITPPEWLRAAASGDSGTVERIAAASVKQLEVSPSDPEPLSLSAELEHLALGRLWVGRPKQAMAPAERAAQMRKNRAVRKRDGESRVLLAQALNLVFLCAAAVADAVGGPRVSVAEGEADMRQAAEQNAQSAVEQATAAARGSAGHAHSCVVQPLYAISDHRWKPFPVRYRMLEMAVRQADLAGLRSLPQLLMQLGDWQQRMAGELVCARCKQRKAERWCDTCEEENRSEGSGTTELNSCYGGYKATECTSTLAPSETGERAEGAGWVRRRPPRPAGRPPPAPAKRGTKRQKRQVRTKTGLSQQSGGSGDTEEVSLLYGATATLPWHPPGKRTTLLCAECHRAAHWHPDLGPGRELHDTQPLRADAQAIYLRCTQLLQTPQFAAETGGGLAERCTLRYAELAGDPAALAGALQGLHAAKGCDDVEVLRWCVRLGQLWGRRCAADPSQHHRGSAVLCALLARLVRAAAAAEARAPPARQAWAAEEMPERHASVVSVLSIDTVTTGGSPPRQPQQQQQQQQGTQRRQRPRHQQLQQQVHLQQMQTQQAARSQQKPLGEDHEEGAACAEWCAVRAAEVAVEVFRLAEALKGAGRVAPRRHLLIGACLVLGCAPPEAAEDAARELGQAAPAAPPEPPGQLLVELQQQALTRLADYYCEAYKASGQQIIEVLRVAGEACAGAAVRAAGRGLPQAQVCEVARPLSVLVLRELRNSPAERDRRKARALFAAVSEAFAAAGLPPWTEGAEPEEPKEGPQSQNLAVADQTEELHQAGVEMRKLVTRIQRHSQGPHGLHSRDLYCQRLLQKAARIRRQCARAKRVALEQEDTAAQNAARRVMRYYDKLIGAGGGKVHGGDDSDDDGGDGADGTGAGKPANADTAAPAAAVDPAAAALGHGGRRAGRNLHARVGCAPSAVHPREQQDFKLLREREGRGHQLPPRRDIPHTTRLQRGKVLDVPVQHTDGSVTVLKRTAVLNSGLWIHRDLEAARQHAFGLTCDIPRR
eukprot:TRINITY_DN141_c1_g1_i2.p1 TRINITY_DN141_c1_g1~~TRINITY_DN141_c1_g1_i2.p1  ORF type:complete len:1602 (+),score=443.79 TRINITY_DN141_c1_g1_i2:108-4913(+)